MNIKLYWSLKKRAYMLDPTPRVARRRGALWLLDPRDWLDMQLLIGRPFETRQLETFCRLCRERSVTRFVDIGANIGLYSVLVAQTVPGIARVDAFEPVSETRWRLCANLGLNGLRERVVVHPVALSDDTEERGIAIDPRSSGIATLSPSAEERARRSFDRRETVRTVSFDSYMPALEGRVAFKIDVEGHEPAVLRGLAGTLGRTAALLQVETRERNRAEVRSFLEGLGYAQAARHDTDLYFVPEAG